MCDYYTCDIDDRVLRLEELSLWGYTPSKSALDQTMSKKNYLRLLGTNGLDWRLLSRLEYLISTGNIKD